jgi:hypothetical protein
VTVTCCGLRRRLQQSSRDAVARAVMSFLPSGLGRYIQAPGNSPAYFFARSAPATALWRERQMSNYEYLMHLNTLAGRTFCDITQYPVFPWVLGDYTSSVLDIASPATYRDLSRPVGALNRERLLEYRRRFEAMADPNMPKFMYGHHYSTAVGTVIHFLLRLYPFTELHVKYQVRAACALCTCARSVGDDRHNLWCAAGRSL